ncbi:MAG: glycoside hydrolase family 3 C-terminal domain-containing protein [Bacteroidota bacterium]|nr:glycoside hydrolase family 3 C-terminal domain-containing protein [Bacteroidota bacterium]
MNKLNQGVIAVALFLSTSANAQTAAPTTNAAPTSPSSIDQLIKKMTLEEKIGLLHANGIFSTAGVARLGIPGFMMDDGPLGIREDLKPGGGWTPANLTTDSATFFPCGSALAATWDPALAYQFGKAMGEEARARNKDIMLAPAFNITRTPLNGRTYEYYSEDPLLNANLASSFVTGIQSMHVAACIKHFALNNQETDRGMVDVHISERALREIYFPAFKMAIEKGNAWTIMSAYNKVRGDYCSENDYLLNKVLRGEWGFKGIVISDWGGTHSTVKAANNGLDIEMGTRPPYDRYFFANPLLDSVKAGKVSEATIDSKVRRILWVMNNTTLYKDRPRGSINTPEHSKTVYDIAGESIVLLKNEKHLLPLQTAGIKTIAVIGNNAVQTFHLGGFGAGVKARYEITALQGLKDALGPGFNILFQPGYNAPSMDYVRQHKIDIDQPDTAKVAAAAALARSSDIAILFIGGNRDYESESRDRKDLRLPFGQQALVDAVTAANQNTIVVVIGGAPYDLTAINRNNHTIVWAWYNGSEGGHALADVLTGKINPSGKLPFTFPASVDQSPAHYLRAYPGQGLKEEYKEGILVGYRWYDTKKIAPLYPFGYGLSYTTFAYGDLHCGQETYSANDVVLATIKVKNSGSVGGKETVQLYVRKNGSAVERAEKELKAFEKVMIPAGQELAVTLKIPVKDLAYYDEKTAKWIVEPGPYSLLAGTSSADIRSTASFTVK